MDRRLFFLLCVALMLPSAASAADSAPPLRVLCFNLRYQNSGDKDSRAWTVRRDLAAQVIKDDQPDLIGYQEALRGMLDDLAGRIPGYQEIGVGREDGLTKGEYAAVWVRKDRFTVLDSGTFWLSDTPEIPNSRTWGNRVTRVCTWAKLQEKQGGQILHFYNLHLDHESQEARIKGIAEVLKHMEARTPAGPWVLTGDFNAGEDNVVINTIRESPLQPVDSWRMLHPDVPAAESGTFHTFTGVIHEAKIDYIFVPRAGQLIDAAILHTNKEGVYPSDHFPVRATVEFAP